MLSVEERHSSHFTERSMRPCGYHGYRPVQRQTSSVTSDMSGGSSFIHCQPAAVTGQRSSGQVRGHSEPRDSSGTPLTV